MHSLTLVNLSNSKDFSIIVISVSRSIVHSLAFAQTETFLVLY